MYYCSDCGVEFDEPQKITENHGLNEPPFEVYLACPKCGSKAFHLKNTTHCRCCGAKLSKGAVEFCSKECRDKSLKLRKEQIRLKLLRSNGIIARIVRENENYNNLCGTNYSYGQYVSILFQTEKKKCKEKKRKKS